MKKQKRQQAFSALMGFEYVRSPNPELNCSDLNSNSAIWNFFLPLSPVVISLFDRSHFIAVYVIDSPVSITL